MVFQAARNTRPPGKNQEANSCSRVVMQTQSYRPAMHNAPGDSTSRSWALRPNGRSTVTSGSTTPTDRASWSFPVPKKRQEITTSVVGSRRHRGGGADRRSRGVVFEEFPVRRFVNGNAVDGPFMAAWFRDSKGNLLNVRSKASCRQMRKAGTPYQTPTSACGLYAGACG